MAPYIVRENAISYMSAIVSDTKIGIYLQVNPDRQRRMSGLLSPARRGLIDRVVHWRKAAHPYESFSGKV
jgi:hypothetical protein